MQPLRPLLRPVLALAVTLGLAACGPSSGDTSTAAGDAAAAAGATTLAPVTPPPPMGAASVALTPAAGASTPEPR